MRPGVTRFATTFLTLQSLMEKKNPLRLIFNSEEWTKCKWSRSAKGQVASAIVLSIPFWNSVTLCLNAFAPLVKVLQLVDGDCKPSMGFLHGELKQAKEDIKVAFKNVENNYKPILYIINLKAEGRLNTPLHLATCLFNPYYFYKDNSIENETYVMDGFITCIERLFPGDLQMQLLLTNVELPKYKKK